MGRVCFSCCFFINRTPSLLLNWQTPFFHLNGHDADYTSLKVFNCLCFASTLPSQRSKFHLREIPSIFMGYHHGIKGYWLYDIENKKFFLARNVIFHEDIFPFHNMNIQEEIVDSFPNLVLPTSLNFLEYNIFMILRLLVLILQM